MMHGRRGMRFKTEEILEATGGRKLTPCPKGFAGISTDSRGIGAGELFVPLTGKNFDGHNFIGAAFDKGAAGALVRKGRRAKAPADAALIEVPDTLRALQDMAHYTRMKHSGLVVVGVTGTNGKTTTKEMLASILSVRGPVLKNEGNLNNEIGVPLTLLNLNDTHWAAVVEMGTSAPGEIARLAEIAAPGTGIITNIGPGHLETLGSLEGVARAKAELVHALPADGKAILNVDDPYLKDTLGAAGDRAVTFGMAPGAAITASDINETADGVGFQLVTPTGDVAVKLPALGSHNVYNALAAAGAAWSLGLTLAEIADGLASYHPAKMRMEVISYAGARIINDAYNANPASMAAALNALVSIREGRRIAVLGDMLELGPAAKKAHYDVGRLAGAVGYALLILVGRHAHDAARGARDAGMPGDNILIVKGPDEAAAVLAEWIRPGDHVLVKGSRSMRMERVVEYLMGRSMVA
jgi:UDP-N-acetylmuramoyl-tripeptide--D-alanyl-D-alanine ligase